MKTNEITKKIDELGRIVIPKEIRRALGVGAGDAMSFQIEGDSLVLRRSAKLCCICGSGDDLTEIKGKHICAECKAELG